VWVCRQESHSHFTVESGLWAFASPINFIALLVILCHSFKKITSILAHGSIFNFLKYKNNIKYIKNILSILDQGQIQEF
jgi:hypothetical protein